MIVFDLECGAAGHRFEGWFGSSDDFVSQRERGLLTCPQCGTGDVMKAPMAPAVGRKGNQCLPAPLVGRAELQSQDQSQSRSPAVAAGPRIPAEAVKLMQRLAVMQADALKNSRWVGDSFAEQSRAMHYGERAVETIHGQATPHEAKALLEEGIEVAPLPFPVAPPGEAN